MQGRLHVASSQSADRQLKVTQRVHKGAILLPVESLTCTTCITCITPGPYYRYAHWVLAPGGACTHFHAVWVSVCPRLTPGAMAKVALRRATLL